MILFFINPQRKQNLNKSPNFSFIFSHQPTKFHIINNTIQVYELEGYRLKVMGYRVKIPDFFSAKNPSSTINGVPE